MGACEPPPPIFCLFYTLLLCIGKCYSKPKCVPLLRLEHHPGNSRRPQSCCSQRFRVLPSFTVFYELPFTEAAPLFLVHGPRGAIQWKTLGALVKIHQFVHHTFIEQLLCAFTLLCALGTECVNKTRRVPVFIGFAF